MHIYASSYFKLILFPMATKIEILIITSGLKNLISHLLLKGIILVFAVQKALMQFWGRVCSFDLKKIVLSFNIESTRFISGNWINLHSISRQCTIDKTLTLIQVLQVTFKVVAKWKNTKNISHSDLHNKWDKMCLFILTAIYGSTLSLASFSVIYWTPTDLWQWNFYIFFNYVLFCTFGKFISSTKAKWQFIWFMLTRGGKSLLETPFLCWDAHLSIRKLQFIIRMVLKYVSAGIFSSKT